jgi:hypothetical protein
MVGLHCNPTTMLVTDGNITAVQCTLYIVTYNNYYKALVEILNLNIDTTGSRNTSIHAKQLLWGKESNLDTTFDVILAADW